MKTRLFRLSLLFLSFTALLCGCANDDEPLLSTDGTTLTVYATADGFASADGLDTRASDNGYTTTFTNGDQIGVFAVKDGQVIADCDNVPLTYNEATLSWEGTKIYYYTGAQYFAYYPYDATMNGKKSVDEIVQAFSPLEDQSTYANYTKSDLMTSEGILSNKELCFSFIHRMSLIEISQSVMQKFESGDENIPYHSAAKDFRIPAPSKFSEAANLTIKLEQQNVENPYSDIQPFLLNGVYRYVVPAGEYRISGNFSAGDGKTIEYATTEYVTLTSGQYKRLNVKCEGIEGTGITTRDIQVGDFYYSDGSIYPGDIGTPSSEGCIGIIFSTDVARIGQGAIDALEEKGVATPHGLVMALTNASEGCRWGADYTNENERGQDGEPFKDGTDNLRKRYNNIGGYAETHWIMDTYKSEGDKLKDEYSAFYQAIRYGIEEENTAKYAAPPQTTGWFLPSIGQWWDILSNLCKMDLSQYQDSREEWVSIPGVAAIAVDNMNQHLDKITGAAPFSSGDSFWSSSERNWVSSCNVDFHKNGNLSLYSCAKRAIDHKVRCVLAF